MSSDEEPKPTEEQHQPSADEHPENLVEKVVEGVKMAAQAVGHALHVAIDATILDKSPHGTK
jgi:hypothetical protein